MIWLELVYAGLAGAVVGWFAHALVRSRRRNAAAPTGEEGTAHRRPTPSTLESPVAPVTATARARVALAAHADADTAGRVILHLASLPRLAYDDIGLVSHTQAGMSGVLSIRQGTLTKVLSRLVAAKVVEVDRRHVHGQPRRLNVYRLTALGESIARDMLRKKTRVPSERGTPPPK